MKSIRYYCQMETRIQIDNLTQIAIIYKLITLEFNLLTTVLF